METVSAPLLLRLTWNDPGTGKYYEQINPLPITIGRAASLNTIVLNNKQISRQHVWLERVNDKILIIDQDSTNGTLVDGRSITQTMLRIGDSFRIGPFTFLTSVVFSTR